MPPRKPKKPAGALLLPSPWGNLLPEEIKCLEQSTRCKCCKHLIVLHHVDTDGYDSFCSIEDCHCCYDVEKLEWAMGNNESRRERE